MKKIIAIILTFLMSTLILIGCVFFPKDNYNPPPEPNNPKYTELAFEEVVEGEDIKYTTYVHLHIPDSNGTRVKMPKVFVHTKDMMYIEEVESLDSFQINGNDDVVVDYYEREVFARKADTPIIDNWVTLSVTFSINNEERVLQMRVTKGEYETES